MFVLIYTSSSIDRDEEFEVEKILKFTYREEVSLTVSYDINLCDRFFSTSVKQSIFIIIQYCYVAMYSFYE